MDDWSWTFHMNSPSLAPRGWGWWVNYFLWREWNTSHSIGTWVHKATPTWSLQWPLGRQVSSHHCRPGPSTPVREALERRLLMKNQDLDFISYSNHMQYMEGGSGEWPMHENVFVGIYNIKLSLSYAIFRCRINLPPLWQQKEWMKKIYLTPQRRNTVWGHTQMTSCRSRTKQIPHIRWKSTHDVRPGSFPRGGNSIFPFSSILPHPT